MSRYAHFGPGQETEWQDHQDRMQRAEERFRRLERHTPLYAGGERSERVLEPSQDGEADDE